MTRILYPEQLEQAAAILQSGGVVAFPTETVYGLGADGINPVAVQKIYRAKNRPASDPLILHLERPLDFAAVADLRGREALLERLAPLMPGALTLVLPKLPHIPLEVTAGGSSVAVRVPAHPLAQALIAAVGVPLAAPSANLFSRPSPTSAQMVLEDLDGRIDAVLDGGSCPIGLESTVLSLLGAPTLLRPGGVVLEQIEACIGEVLLPYETLSEQHIQPAPGMLLKHYSPRAQMLLVSTPKLLLEVGARYQEQRLGLLLPSQSLEHVKHLRAERFDLGADDLSIAMRLFAGLRALDALGCTHILAHKFTNRGLGRALNDRLYRAASGKVIG
ncbi:MAG: L-threonylcarbamoyladenylate synthase [Deinococcales bacterium]